MAREFISEIELLRLKQNCHTTAGKLDRLLFPNGVKSVKNLNCDEINEVISEFINSRIGQENVLMDLCYIVDNFSDGVVNTDENYIHEAALVSEIVKHKDVFIRRINEKCRNLST